MYDATRTIDVGRLKPAEFKALKARYPSRFWVPNVAQERMFKALNSENYPRVLITTFGNRTGKTEGLAEILTGVVKGQLWVNKEWCKCRLFDEFNEKRAEGKLTVWWCCEGEMMKRGGPNFKIIQRHIPDAGFGSRTNNGVYREIKVPVAGSDGQTIEIVVVVKTYDMDPVAFAGENVDVMIFDEPPPQSLWGEVSARMINLAGEKGGIAIIGGTPLKLAGYMSEMIEEGGDDGRVVHCKGSIWENCDGRELPPEQAQRLGIKRDERTGEYITRGYLSAEGILNAIENWKKSGDPDELNARIDGEFTHAQGKIYKNFSDNAHVIAPYSIPNYYPVVQIVDPHDATPDCAGWFMVTPRNKLVGIAEYPQNVHYELITGRDEGIVDTCEHWRMIEAEMGIEGQVVARFADPNKMMDPDPFTLKTLQQLYAEQGFNFNCHFSDNLEYGHEKAREFLYYDQAKFEAYPDNPLWQPGLVFFNTMRNHIMFLKRYGRKEWKDPGKPFPDRVSDKWKHFADIVRYLCVTFRSYDEWKAEMNGERNEWDAIQRARGTRNRFEQPSINGARGVRGTRGRVALSI